MRRGDFKRVVSANGDGIFNAAQIGVMHKDRPTKPKKKPYNPYGKEAKWLRQLSATSKQMPYCME